MTEHKPSASSSTAGFFQTLPVLLPPFTEPSILSQDASTRYQNSVEISDDKVIARIVQLYLPQAATEAIKHAHRLARLSLHPSILKFATDAETNHPTLRPLNTFGAENKDDPLWTTSGWQRLKEIGYREGIVSVAYEKSHTTFNRRVQQFVGSHVWEPTGTVTSCPQSMTDGAATLLDRHRGDSDGDQPGRSAVLQEAYRRLISRDSEIAWTSGQWMTERSGGSDVSGTETLAIRMTGQELESESEQGGDVDAIGMKLGPWRIDGFKWFSSATDSEMAVLLARTSKGGISAFYMPMRRRVGSQSPASSSANRGDLPRTELNGVRIQRLKNKLGTKSLPTAELELKGARGWLIGTEGQGIKEISAILNITRLHTAAISAASWARGLAICRAYSKVRKVRGGLLQDNPVHLRWMAEETVKYWASAQFTFLGAALQGTLEQDWKEMVANTKAAQLLPRDKPTISALLRLLLPAMKAQVSVASVHGLRQCMECLGGVGYCENNEDGGLMNIAKIYRDNLVNPIWEGTVSVMVEDVIRVLTDTRLADGDVLANAFVPWVRGSLNLCRAALNDEVLLVEERLQALIDLAHGTPKHELLYCGREILQHLEVITSGVVLLFDAVIAPDDVAREVAVRWIRYNSHSGHGTSKTRFSEDTMSMDKRIFLGISYTGTAIRANI
ncbi:acyl- oxidase type 1 [Stemphylium lycopersici]|uniref:Acyl-oxidase type 1 n=1 Tax=Stemphylium lycopersici TaxID=183478 RepID=A0A364MTN4_STELY|nr:acyl- oxidase type 1 [Stemphylium lycopersici]RAQ99103.1 acyl- oxidase type 1 [Stemphylium lycopersici]RAR03227.1 acyl- oxidase type 1 [Stemphylium lycopersici]